ncbi:MAG: hypothetical protein LBU97_03890, partial [Alistipes sp.]|nr:hypothetical protein [Alistipes sp.]
MNFYSKLLSAAFLLAVSSCIHDPEGGTRIPGNNGRPTNEVTFVVDVPVSGNAPKANATSRMAGSDAMSSAGSRAGGQIDAAANTTNIAESTAADAATRTASTTAGGNGHFAGSPDGLPGDYRDYREGADIEINGSDFGGYPDAETEVAAFETAVAQMAANYQQSPMKYSGIAPGNTYAPYIPESAKSTDGTDNNKTRAITEGSADDNEIGEIAILLFEGDNNGTPGGNRFTGMIEVGGGSNTTLESVPGDPRRRRFTLRLPDSNYKALFIAGGRTYIDAFIASVGGAEAAKSKTLNDFSNGMVINNPGKWPADPTASGYKPFPMSSRVEDFVVPSERDYERKPVELARAVAKINLTSRLDYDGIDNPATPGVDKELVIIGAMLVNKNSGGTLVPADGWKKNVSLFDATAVRAISNTATQDLTALTNTVDGAFNGGNTQALIDFPNLYLVDGILEMEQNGVPEPRIVDEIFAFEQEVSDAAPISAPSLIVIGMNPYTYGDIRYYRVNLTKENPDTGKEELVNIVRNFRYDIEIVDANTAGYPSAEEAYDHPGGLVTDIVAVDTPKGLDEVTYNGEYQLAVDRSVVIVPFGGEASIQVYTDYEHGWSFEAGHNDSRLVINQSTNRMTLSDPPRVQREITPYYTYSANGPEASTMVFKNLSAGVTDSSQGHNVWRGTLYAGELHKEITIVWLPASKDVTINMPESVNTYVGAFWRANQTGERLIRIPRPATNIIDGEWWATVLDGSDWVVIDNKPSTDDGLNGSDPGFDAAHKVDTATQWATGTLDANSDEVYFRIGLRSPYIATPDAPVRYATVLVTYGQKGAHAVGGVAQQLLFIRQGEEADYIIPNGEAVTGNRTGAVKFSPYNLTVPDQDVET